MNVEDPEALDPLVNIHEQFYFIKLLFKPKRNLDQSQVARDNIQFEIQNVFSHSYLFNSISLIISFLKILASFFILFMYPNGCNIKLRLWIILMICYDFIHAFVSLMRILNAVVIRNFGFLSNRINLNRNYNNFATERQGVHNINNFNGRNENGNGITSNFIKFIDLINEGNWLFYVGIFIWGHILLFMTENNCKQGF